MHKARGYKTTIEHARHYIDSESINGRTVEEVRKNPKKFQLEILEMQFAQEDKISHEDIVFLDRASPDDLAYYRFLNLPEDKELLEALSNACYKKVFILDCLALVKDYARTEDEATQKKDTCAH